MSFIVNCTVWWEHGEGAGPSAWLEAHSWGCGHLMFVLSGLGVG